MAIPERYRWAIDILDVKPNETILEIGCGYGHSISLICEKLTTGHLTAIDRSDKMAEAASEANRQFIDSGLVTILHQDLLHRALPAAHFDKVFLFNINVFWMDPGDELAEIRRLLKPTGKFCLFHQPPPGHDLGEFEHAFLANLRLGAFKILASHKNRSDETRSLAIIACPRDNFL